MQTAYQHPKVLRSVFRQFVCCQVDTDYVEEGLFVSLLRFGRFVEPLDETLQIGPHDGGLVGRRVDLLLQQVGQGFKPGAFFQKSFALLALNQWNVDVVLLASAFAVDPYSGADTQPNVPRDIKPQIDLRLSRAVGCSADIIVGIYHTSKLCISKGGGNSTETCNFSCPYFVRIFKKRWKSYPPRSK